MECDHKFVYVNDDDCYTCMNCTLEPNPILTFKRRSYEKKKRPKQNDLETIKDLENLYWINPDISSTAYEMYQQATENKIYRSKMRKMILCTCICKAYAKHNKVCDVQFFLHYFSISF